MSVDVRFSYTKPEYIKKIFANFKSVHAEFVHILFTPSAIRICGNDHERRTDTFMNIDASRATEYQCASPVFVSIRHDEIDKIIQKIDKKYKEIQITYSAQQASGLSISLFRGDMSTEESHIVTLSQLGDSMVADLLQKTTTFVPRAHLSFPIQFRMSANHIKKIIGNIRKFSRTVTITYNPVGNPLVMTYVSEKKSVIGQNIYTNRDELCLNVNPTITTSISETLDCDVFGAFVTSTNEDIEFAIAPGNAFIMYISLDSGIVSSTFIIGQQPRG